MSKKFAPSASSKTPTIKHIPRVQISPASFRYLKQNHPWVTKDPYTERFPNDKLFLRVSDSPFLLLHDPLHPHVKARLWSQKIDDQVKEYSFRQFKEEFHLRLDQAIKRRKPFFDLKERDHFYLVFGEADHMPGLFIQKQGDTIIIQYYAFFWQKLVKDELIQSIKEVIEANFPAPGEARLAVQAGNNSFVYLHQERGPNQGFVPVLDSSSLEKESFSTVVEEFGLKYQLNFEKYDFGIYTDMFSIRKKINPLLKNRSHQEMLNLFAFTGSFSLQGLSHAMKVTSVDLSKKNSLWLEENIHLNSDQLNYQNHQMITGSTHEAILKFAELKKKFDVIVCDPPPIISIKKEKYSSMEFYLEFLPTLIKITNDGGLILILLNTHKVKTEKFREKIQETLIKNRLISRIKKTQYLKLDDDCPTVKSFPEGDYLKGILLTL